MASDYLRLRLNRLAFGELDRARFSAAAVLTAGVYFFSVFDLSFLLKGNLWRLGHSDIGLNFVGFLYFVRDQWRFPLFLTQNLGYPYGTNIILTDSTPLLSLVFKILSPTLPSGFAPFSLWILLCYLLLAHAFSSLLFHFGHRNLLAAIAGAMFAVMTPFFAVLLVIPSLEAQFLILYAFLLYFKVADGQPPGRPLAWFTLLLVAAVLTELYLFAMVLVVYACTLVNGFFQSNRSRRALGMSLAVTFTAVLATMVVAGYFPSTVPWTGSSGFGHFSMNLLAPITPARFRPDGTLYYMNLAIQPDATGGQYEGFSYWGAGIFLLLCVTAPAWLLGARAWFRLRLWPLLAGLSILTTLALSNRVYFGRHLLLSYNFPHAVLSLANQFHSSGRFSWVVSYCVMVFAVSQGLRLRPPWLAAVLVMGGVGLQLADTHSLRNSLRHLTRATEAQSITEERWRPIVAAHQRMALIPPAPCGGFWDLYSEIGGIAARSDVAMHSVRMGRYGPSAPESCRTLQREVLEQGFQPGVLYLFEPAPFRSIRERPELEKFCAELEGRYLCTLQRAALSLPPLAPGPGPALWSPTTGSRKAPQLADFLGMGWSSVEEGGVWSLGDRSELFFRLPSCGEARGLRLKILPFGEREVQTVTTSANGGLAVTRHYRERQLDELILPIGTCDPAHPQVAVSVQVERSLSPLEAGESGDTRPLGIFLLEAELVQPGS